MGSRGLFDLVPVWGVFLATVVAVSLAIEGGLRVGRYRRGRSEQEDRPPVGEMVAAALTLLALLLAFTFGLAASRFDVRKNLVVDEANAIGTTYLRTGLIPEPHRSDVRTLLRDYVEARLAGVQPGRLAESIRRSEQLQARLWAHAVAVGETHSGSIMAGLFIQSLNEVIDLHAKRVAFGAGSRIPGTIWGALYFVALLSMAVVGYHAGLAGSGRSLAIPVVVLAFAAVIALIADLDRPQQGLLRVTQQSMIDLRRAVEIGR